MTIHEKKKLTLRLNQRLIEQAKAYAAQHNISVSELVETYFSSSPRHCWHCSIVYKILLFNQIDLMA